MNTAVKIAQKRAMVDAVKRVGALSDVFTQDVEDDAYTAKGKTGTKPYVSSKKGSYGGSKPASTKQISYLKSLRDEREVGEEELEKMSDENIDKLTGSQASELIGILKDLPKKKLNPPPKDGEPSLDDLPF